MPRKNNQKGKPTRGWQKNIENHIALTNQKEKSRAVEKREKKNDKSNRN